MWLSLWSIDRGWGREVLIKEEGNGEGGGKGNEKGNEKGGEADKANKGGWREDRER